jgi:hypothetical protein
VGYIGKYKNLKMDADCASTMRVAGVRDVMDRLADYEDTGLTPEEIKNLLQGTLRKN